MRDELADWTSHGEAVLFAHKVLSLPPREKAIIERMLVYASNRAWPDGPDRWPETERMMKAAGMTPAEIARVRAPIEEGWKEKQAAGAVIAPFPGRRLPP